jgi:excisionase family DNA binding protein
MFALRSRDTPDCDTSCMNTQTVARGDTLLTPADVAQLAQISRPTVYRSIASGELKALRAGGQLRIRPRDFVDWLERENT